MRIGSERCCRAKRSIADGMVAENIMVCRRSGTLAMIFRSVSFKPAEAGISIIRNLVPPPERPIFRGDDGVWRTDRMDIPLTRFSKAPLVGS